MRLAARILTAYVLLTLLFTGVLTAAFSIPTRALEDHVRQSVQQVAGDGPMFTWQVGLLQPYKLGSFSDCLMMGIAYSADNSRPLQSAMSAVFPMKDGSPVAGARLMLDSPDAEGLQPVVYSRYWHGNQALLRPLLCVTTVRGLRAVNMVLLTLLLVALFVVMGRRTNLKDALIVTLCLAAVMIPSVPLCMNYVPCFYIALTASLLILTWEPVTARWENTVLAFFVIGALTTFFDLLTTPMIAMAVPLTVYMLYRRPEHTWRTLILLALAWLLGYASLWATKWLLAVLLTGHAAFQDAFGAVTQRTVGHGEGDYMLWCLKMTCLVLAAVVAATAAVIAAFGQSRQSLCRHSWLLLLAMSSFVWTFVLLEHTWHHLHFTWRTYVVLLIGITLYLRYTLDLRHPFALFKK